MAFYSGGECIHFACTGESSVTAALCETLGRTAVRLRWEEVLSAMPSRAVFFGGFSEDEGGLLGEALRIDWRIEEALPVPTVPKILSTPLSPNADLRRQQRVGRRKALRLGAIGAAVYAVFLMGIGIDLLAGHLKERSLAMSVGGIESAAIEARNRLAAWKNARPAVDPTLFAIDQLAAVAARIPGDRVRLTEYE